MWPSVKDLTRIICLQTLLLLLCKIEENNSQKDDWTSILMKVFKDSQQRIGIQTPGYMASKLIFLHTLSFPNWSHYFIQQISDMTTLVRTDQPLPLKDIRTRSIHLARSLPNTLAGLCASYYHTLKKCYSGLAMWSHRLTWKSSRWHPCYRTWPQCHEDSP